MILCSTRIPKNFHFPNARVKKWDFLHSCQSPMSALTVRTYGARREVPTTVVYPWKYFVIFDRPSISKRIITPVNGQLAAPQKQIYWVEGCCHHYVGYLLLNKSCLKVCCNTVVRFWRSSNIMIDHTKGLIDDKRLPYSQTHAHDDTNLDPTCTSIKLAIDNGRL